MEPPPPRRERPWGVAAAALVAAVALVEAVNGLAAPLFAPDDADWRAAVAAVRAGFRPGDLVVAAPAWADQVMRLHLGDLVPAATAGRMDAARYARVWEIAQRGARAQAETDGGRAAASSRHGALRVSLVEKRAAVVTYDFLERWAEARVFRDGPGGDVLCPWDRDRFQCPGERWNHVRRQTVEVDGTLRRALLARPVGDEPLVIEYPVVTLGREMAVGVGLHNVWARKGGDGTVALRVLVDGRPVLAAEADNESGWLVARADTGAHAGRTAAVRFEVTSSRPRSRDFSFAAEARN